MQIRVGYDLTFDCPQPLPMIVHLNVHYSRASDLIRPDSLLTVPTVPISSYRDSFGNWVTRLVAPAGRIRLTTDALVLDSGLPDPVFPELRQHPGPGAAVRDAALSARQPLLRDRLPGNSRVVDVRPVGRLGASEGDL